MPRFARPEPTSALRRAARGAAVALAMLLGAASPLRGDSPAALEPDSEGAGQVRQFYSRVVTGPLMNRSVCFVCRYGDRPVAMVLTRKIGPELRPLVKNIDRIVEQHRAGGLRSFGVFVTDQSFPAISSVQTFAFNNRVAMPLAVGTEAAETAQDVPPGAAVTVVLYHRQTVVSRYTLREDELDVAHYTPIIEGLKSFAAERAAVGSEGADAAE